MAENQKTLLDTTSSEEETAVSEKQMAMTAGLITHV